MSVNGVAAQQLQLSGTSFSVPTSTTVPVALQAGENTVRLFNDTAFAPDIDRVAVTS